VRVTRETVEESLQILVQQSVPLNLLGEIRELLGSRQLAVDQQIADFQEIRALSELLNGIPAIAQNPGITVDIANLGGAGSGVHKAGIEGNQAGVRRQFSEFDNRCTFGCWKHIELRLAARQRKPDGSRTVLACQL